MEISLSPELMAILEKLVGTFSKVQSQYLITLIPTLGMFLLYFVIIYPPGFCWLKKWWWERKIEKQTGGVVVSLVHSTPKSLLGMFKMPMVTLDDSHKILKALREIPEHHTIILVLHTPGGMVIAAEQIARAILMRKGKVHAYIPQYAMSGGTLIALACASIHLGPNALLGPLDPQLSIGLFDVYPAASLLKAIKQDNPNRDDKTLILADLAEKAITQMRTTVAEVLTSKIGVDNANKLACQLCEGNWTHDYGINLERAKGLGLDVNADMPEGILKFVEAFPCESSVSYRKPKKEERNDGTIRITL